jgi:multiple sugar transport system ATP-binding protein
LQRKPAALSGGQRQRVAIGRALVRDVNVFLFDEPLSNLDAKLRSELRVEIKRLHQRLGNTMIYVTHDQIEAMTLADRIAVMRGGLIQQLDAPQAIYSRPVNRFVAGFIGSPGMNFIDGTVESGGFKVGDIAIPLDRYDSERGTQSVGTAAFGVRPEHIAFGEQAASMPFRREVEIEIVEPMGSDTLVWSKLGAQNIAFRVPSEKTLHVGDRVPIGFDPVRASIFDNASGSRI